MTVSRYQTWADVVAESDRGGIQVDGMSQIGKGVNARLVILAIVGFTVTVALIGINLATPQYQYAWHRDIAADPDLYIVTGTHDAVLDVHSGALHVRTWLLRTCLTGVTESVTYTNYPVVLARPGWPSSP